MKKVNTIKVGMIVLVATLILTNVSCKKKGCTDPTAINYNQNAKKDDGSCNFAPVLNGNVVKSGFIVLMKHGWPLKFMS